MRHVPVHTMRGQAVHEIWLGYGTLNQQIAHAGALYTGLDIAAGTVDMVNHRLRKAGLPGKAIQGSMLECPLPGASTDCVASIGCFHHRDNLQRCIDETFRLLKPGGRAFITVCNRFSYRQWARWPLATLRSALGKSDAVVDSQRKGYNTNAAGDGAPDTGFTTIAEMRAMLGRFTQVSVERENCEYVSLRGRTLIPRGLLLGTLVRISGLDLYATATK